MEKYQHGGDVYTAAERFGVPLDQICDFSANINPLVTIDWLKAKLAPFWEQVLHYPDPHYKTLYEGIATYHGVPSEQIVLGNGATALIYQLVETLKPLKARVSAPTFAEYEKALRHVGAQVTYLPASANDLSIDPQQLFGNLDGETVVFLCNPNNPTGNLVPLQDLVAALEVLDPKVTAIVDEAFIDFTPLGEAQSLTRHLERFSNVVILRSATKFYGMPGLRFGYLLCGNAGLAMRMRLSQPIWQINVMAAGIVQEGLLDLEFQEATRLYVAKEREFVTGALKALGFKVYPSLVNYVLVVPPHDFDVQGALAPIFALARSCDNYVGLKEGLWRLAIKSHEDNLKMIDAFQMALSSCK